jgi:putative endonuclease
MQSGMSHDARQSLGKLGEDLACAELARRGYAILARRYRTRFGEIDIVARDGEVTVFVEVKARTGGEFGGGAAAVTGLKQHRITQMAVDYLARHRLHNRPCRSMLWWSISPVNLPALRCMLTHSMRRNDSCLN